MARLKPVCSLGAALSLALIQAGLTHAQPETEPDLPAAVEEPTDPCAAGRFGSAVELIDTRPVELDYELRYEEPVPTHDLIDPCGLRFADLSGVWTFNGYQAVGYHNLRTGEFRMRFTYVPRDQDYRRIWDYRFGDDILRGFITPDENDISVVLVSRYPPSYKESCPEQWEREMTYHRFELGYDNQGRIRLSGTRPLTRIQDDCHVYIHDFVSDSIVRTGVEDNP